MNFSFWPFALLAVALIALVLINHTKIAAWWTRVHGTKGAQKALSDVDAMEALVERVWEVIGPKVKAAEQRADAAMTRANSAIKAAVAKPAPSDPAAPAASVATDPPAVAVPAEPAAPSAGANGIDVKLVVTQSDQVAGAHAALDALIASAQAQLDAAKAAKDRLTAAQAELVNAAAAAAAPTQVPAGSA